MGIKDISAAKFSSSVMQEGRQMFRTSENFEVICSKIAIVLHSSRIWAHSPKQLRAFALFSIIPADSNCNRIITSEAESIEYDSNVLFSRKWLC